MKLYLVGGAVRDSLLNRPIKDKDYVVVNATEADLIALGYQKMSKKDISVFLDPKNNIEYALARREDKYDLRNKIINFSYKDVSLVEDLYRRDFTVNAMALDEQSGELVDPFNGQEDLKNKVLKHVSERFEEDPLRIVRGYRFSVEYGFSIDKETLKLFSKMIRRGDLKYILNGRIYLEMTKVGDKLTELLKRINEDGFLQDFFPNAKMFDYKISSPEDAVIALYSQSKISGSIKDQLVHYGFDKKMIEKLVKINHSNDLFSLLTKDLKIDQVPLNLDLFESYYKNQNPGLVKIAKAYKDALSKETFDQEKQSFVGKELGEKILSKKKQIFDKILMDCSIT